MERKEGGEGGGVYVSIHCHPSITVYWWHSAFHTEGCLGFFVVSVSHYTTSSLPFLVALVHPLSCSQTIPCPPSLSPFEEIAVCNHICTWGIRKRQRGRKKEEKRYEEIGERGWAKKEEE